MKGASTSRFKTHRLTVDVDAKPGITKEKVRTLLERLIHAGLADATDSLDTDFDDPDTKLALALTVHSPVHVGLVLPAAD